MTTGASFLIQTKYRLHPTAFTFLSYACCKHLETRMHLVISINNFHPDILRMMEINQLYAPLALHFTRSSKNYKNERKECYHRLFGYDFPIIFPLNTIKTQKCFMYNVYKWSVAKMATTTNLLIFLLQKLFAQDICQCWLSVG